MTFRFWATEGVRETTDIIRRASIDDKFRAMNTSLVFGERVGCTIENSWKLVGCVRRGREGKDAVALPKEPSLFPKLPLWRK